VNVNFMRRLIAFAMVALLALTMALTVLGCGAKKEEASSTPPASEMPPAGSSMGSDSTMMADSSSMGH
jgi:preprotein translocase subunit SecG